MDTKVRIYQDIEIYPYYSLKEPFGKEDIKNFRLYPFLPLISAIRECWLKEGKGASIKKIFGAYNAENQKITIVIETSWVNPTTGRQFDFCVAHEPTPAQLVGPDAAKKNFLSLHGYYENVVKILNH